MSKIVIGGGCFWGVQAYFDQLKGVLRSEVGYAQGDIDDPNYELVKTGVTKHREVCLIEYDEKLITLARIIDHFFRIVDPTLKNRQGADIGSQYQCGIYYIEDQDKTVIEEIFENKSREYRDELMCELSKLTNYYKAEAYHQKYLFKHPSGYCHVDFSKIKDDEKKVI